MKIRSFLLLAVVLTLPLRAQESLPVVDFGDNLFWYSTAIPQYRAGTAGVTREKLAEGEFISGHPFSLDMPLSPVTGDYNVRGNNTRFYGGMKVHCWDNPTNKYSWSEGGSNTEHEGFDDFNFMANALESLNTPEKPGNRLKASGIWLWKKEDFLNGGDKFPVTFDETSRVGVFLSRTYPVNDAHAKRLLAEGKISKDTRPFTDTYANQRLEVVPRENWRGWESVHLVVRDGEQFYVAETDFEPYAQTLFEVSPTKVKWAKYNPQGPWDFEFDPKSATFEPHEFKDVTSAGWMILKNTIENATLWLKWYGFGMDAVVNRPWEAGVNVPMAKLEGPAGKDGLYMAKSEVTYEPSKEFFPQFSRWFREAKPDVVVSTNIQPYDWLTSAVHYDRRQKNRTIPGDVGFVCTRGSSGTPQVAHMDLREREQGRQAVDLVHQQPQHGAIGKPEIPLRLLIPPVFVDGPSIR